MGMYFFKIALDSSKQDFSRPCSVILRFYEDHKHNEIEKVFAATDKSRTDFSLVQPSLGIL